MKHQNVLKKRLLCKIILFLLESSTIRSLNYSPERNISVLSKIIPRNTGTTTESVWCSSEMVFHSGGADPPSCESFGAKFIPVGRPKSLNLLLRSYFGPCRIPTVNEIRWDHVPMRSIVPPYGWYRLPRL